MSRVKEATLLAVRRAHNTSSESVEVLLFY